MGWLTQITTSHYLVLAAVLFMVGVTGVLLRKNGLIVFMSVELMLNAANLTFIALSRQIGAEAGHVMVFFVMTVAAVEAAVGLALFVALFRLKATVYVDQATELKH